MKQVAAVFHEWPGNDWSLVVSDKNFIFEKSDLDPELRFDDLNGPIFELVKETSEETKTKSMFIDETHIQLAKLFCEGF